jgi:hypothetical protein
MSEDQNIDFSERTTEVIMERGEWRMPDTFVPVLPPSRAFFSVSI